MKRKALLDVYTIEKGLGEGIKDGQIGDLANGRTVCSLAYYLSKCTNVKIYFVSPAVVKIKFIKVALSKNDLEEEQMIMKKLEATTLLKRHSRFTGMMEKHAEIMHPLSRLDKITVDVDEDPKR